MRRRAFKNQSFDFAQDSEHVEPSEWQSISQKGKLCNFLFEITIAMVRQAHSPSAFILSVAEVVNGVEGLNRRS